MKRFVTRWALTSGVRVMEGTYTEDEKWFRGVKYGFLRSSEVFKTLPEAVAHARVMARKKAESLAAQSMKLSDPKWEPKVVEA